MKKYGVLMALYSLAVVGVFSAVILHLNARVKRLESRREVVYRVDNAGGNMALVGKVTGKQVSEVGHVVIIGGYGKFLVSKEQYDSLQIGDDAPKVLKQSAMAGIY